MAEDTDDLDSVADEIDASITNALHKAEKAFDKSMSEDGWDIWVLLDLKATKVADDGTPLKQYDVKNSVQMADGTSFRETILVTKEEFKSDNFSSITTDAKAVIEKASQDELLALTITMSSPFKVIEARVYTREVFEAILNEE